MLEFLTHIDKELFLFFNQTLSNNVFDVVMPWLRNKYNWIPLYLFISVWLVYRFRVTGVVIILALLAVFGLSDFISSSIVKPFFERLRPCNDPGFRDQVRLVISCGPGLSFTSTHATNHFGLAVIFGLIFRHVKWAMPLALIWAFLIAISQVYVGVHYPFDILGGALLGTFIAFIIWFFYQKISRRFALSI